MKQLHVDIDKKQRFPSSKSVSQSDLKDEIFFHQHYNAPLLLQENGEFPGKHAMPKNNKPRF